MQFVHNDLGVLNGGEVVEVTLASQANVKLMDSSNFASYQQGGGHRFIGGRALRSPLRLQVPNAGHWHVLDKTGPPYEEDTTGLWTARPTGYAR